MVAAGLIVLAIALFAPHQLPASLAFTAESLLGIAPWLALSVALAAYAKASRADALIAGVFVGSPARMIFMGSVFGALSPFCSCGVVPVIAGLLGAGVPLAGVMAFWMSSPLMDPEMFGIIAASLGLEFAIVKTLAAIALGVFGGIITHLLVARGFITSALRSAPGGCCAPGLGAARPDWNVFADLAARRAFFNNALSNGGFLLRWMVIAFLLESLMVAYVPADKVVTLLGNNAGAIPLAVLAGVPSYLNSYAAIPLVRGLMDLGMNPAVALAFLIGGAVTSIPAATAVWALVRPRVFALYLGMAFFGALGAGYGYSAWLAMQ
ncbi:MAG TPA: permease [Telluria sp.]